MKPITPYLWFDKEAKEAAQFYCSIFPNSKISSLKTISNTPSGDCDIVAFELNGQPFMPIRAGPHFKFNDSISFMVSCETQAEIDRYWEQLSAVPAAEQCGWLKDKYGLSCQIVPAAMTEMMAKGTPEQMTRVTQAFMKMKKFDIAELQRAFDGSGVEATKVVPPGARMTRQVKSCAIRARWSP
jgi:predicted 3-demethylubiquinone-9 3-methyltransferase (glyoxalase superfamily)